MVYYKNDNGNVTLKSVMEGQMVKGYFEGYARQMEAGISWEQE